MVQCKLCLEIIQSHHRHDFKWCSCRTVYIDGGPEYQRVGWESPLPYNEVLETDPAKFILR
jgi:hypothetical protein